MIIVDKFVINKAGTPVSDSENNYLDNIDNRASPAFVRKNYGSFNAGCSINDYVRMESNDSMSADVTPNGSLRRQRNRQVPGEDALINFLMSSETNDRNTYGSLGIIRIFEKTSNLF